MNNLLSRAQLRARYRITGHLVLDTALHVGGGRDPLAGTDSPVVRNGVGDPFIPGSSLKGAFRATVERLVPNLGLAACGLGGNSTVRCAGIIESELGKAYQIVWAALGHRPDAKERQALTKLGRANWNGREIDEETLLQLLDLNLCAVCKAFGAPQLASVVHFHDASVVRETWIGLTQVRDGVGIDRDSERARDKVKFDFEVVPPQTAFAFDMTLENPSSTDLGLVALGLQELINGMVPLGGLRSRGLGRCHLENVTIKSVNFADEQAFKQYLLENKMAGESPDSFIQRHLATLLRREEGPNAQTASE
jgi:CRISPR-associated RAMP protein (TIGR02581 family)